MKPKLCYVLPEYQKNDKTHYYQVQELIRTISKDFDIFLIVEKGQNPKGEFGNIKTHKSFFSFQPLKFIDIYISLLSARIFGYKDFYIHYSFTGAIIASSIVKILGGRTFYWNCGEPWKYKRSFLRNFFETLAYHMVTFQVTGDEVLASGYSKAYMIPVSKIKIMPNWINLTRFSKVEDKNKVKDSLNIPINNKVVLFVHRLSNRKGANMILPVAREVLIKSSNTTFIIIGEGPNMNEMMEEIKKDKLLIDSVRLDGAIPNEDINKYFIASDVFFMPSEEEGFPKVILESMAYGIPYVASSVGAVSSVTPSVLKSYVISERSVSVFSNKILELLSFSDIKMVEISKELKEFVKRYDISNAVDRFRNLINQK